MYTLGRMYMGQFTEGRPSLHWGAEIVIYGKPCIFSKYLDAPLIEFLIIVILIILITINVFFHQDD